MAVVCFWLRSSLSLPSEMLVSATFGKIPAAIGSNYLNYLVLQYFAYRRIFCPFGHTHEAFNIFASYCKQKFVILTSAQGKPYSAIFSRKGIEPLRKGKLVNPYPGAHLALLAYMIKITHKSVAYVYHRCDHADLCQLYAFLD